MLLTICSDVFDYVASSSVPLLGSLPKRRSSGRSEDMPVSFLTYHLVSIRDRSRFAAGWTLVFSVALTLMFLHPSLWRHPIASASSQAIWVLMTWCTWVAATATANRALPLVRPKAYCAGVDYCTQLRAAFGENLFEIFTG